MSLANAAVIDVHAHVVLTDTMGAAGRFGPILGQHDDGMPWFQVGKYRLDGVKGNRLNGSGIPARFEI